MNSQERVSSVQMSTLFLFFMTGSSIVIVPAPLTSIAGNGAWISLLIALALGMILLACILYMHHKSPEQSLIEQSQNMLGNIGTFILFLPFICLLFWNVAGIVIEIGVFFKSTMLKETPPYVVHTLFFITIALTASAGLVSMARMALLLLTLMFGFIILVLVLVGPLYHPEYLLPVMPDGIKPILNAAYVVYGFPYAELIVFSAILKFVQKQEKKKLGKHMYIAIIINAVTLIASIVCSIMVLGPLSGDLKYSLYQLARLIYIQEIIERIESVIGFSLIVGFYFKAAIMLLILMKMLKELLSIKNERFFVFPVAFVCLLLSLTTYTQESEMNELVTITWPLLNAFAYSLPFLIVMVIAFFRSPTKNNKKQQV